MMKMVAEAKKLVPAITPSDAAKLIAQGGAITIDVRNAGEIAQSGMVSGALHIPLDRIAEDCETALAKNKTILLYCASGARSALAGKLLLERGYGDVRNIGSYKQWTESGGAVERA